MGNNACEQQELQLPFPELGGDVPLLPARMINEYCYCPRLAYLEWVQGEWDDSVDTVQGRWVHRRVDKPGGKLPPAAQVNSGSDDDGDAEKIHARSIELSSNRLGLIARMDLIEGRGSNVTPVDYKRGKRPSLSRLLSPTALRSPRPGAGHDGALQTFDRRLRSTAGHQ